MATPSPPAGRRSPGRRAAPGRAPRLDHLADLVLDAQRRGEEVAERHHLAGRQHHELLGGGTADGRLVHADQGADLGARQRHQVLDPMQQIVALPVDQALGDPLQGRATAVDVVDEEAGAPHVLADVLALRLGRRWRGACRPTGARRSGRPAARSVVTRRPRPSARRRWPGSARRAARWFGRMSPARWRPRRQRSGTGAGSPSRIPRRRSPPPGSRQAPTR